jgi:hypothetical protein
MVDRAGYFTPAFKDAVHELVDAKHGLADATQEKQKLSLEEPTLKKQVEETDAQTVALRQELAKYEHPDETDFVALQALMGDTTASLDNQIAMAQAYVWTYPASVHEGDAQTFLEQAKKKLADQQEAEKQAEAAREAAHAKMVQRAQAHDLTVSEWRDFLRDMSQDDLVKLIGRPNATNEDYWTYNGAWIVDPTTHQKVGIQINFNAGRVLNVDEIPPPP